MVCHGLTRLGFSENKEDGSKDDKQQRLTPGLEALLGVAEAHSKDNGNTVQQEHGDAGMAAASYPSCPIDLGNCSGVIHSHARSILLICQHSSGRSF